MTMQEHIVAAMREQLTRWDELLATLSEEQITAPTFDDGWSIKDVVAHLWAWQQISNARLQAGVLDREPVFPEWLTEWRADWEEDADRTNAHVFEITHVKPWSEMYALWKQGYLRLLESGSALSERDLLDSDRFRWLEGYTLAFILEASYNHHQEHYEILLEWREQQGN